MTPKHTPGPWTAEYNPDTECWEVNEPYDGLHCPTMFEGSQADAQLLAAAPDMLAALQAVIEQRNNPRRDSDDEHAYQNAFKLAFAAIAKAQGADPK